MPDFLPVVQPGRPFPASTAPPIFDKIGIVGLGLIGGSIALAARQLWPKALVIGVDNKDVLETAMRLHAIGRRDKVAPVARAAVAVGADGLLIEVHCDPDHALSDGAHSMFPAQFDRLMAELRIIAPAIGRSICLETVARRGWGA